MAYRLTQAVKAKLATAQRSDLEAESLVVWRIFDADRPSNCLANGSMDNWAEVVYSY
jgi:hypothetical protein